MTDRPRSSLAVWLIIGLVLLPALNVVSVGPAAWLCRYGYISAKTLEAIYSPLSYLMLHCGPIEKVIDWYIGLWL
jgi:hypothetical protein